MKVKFTRAIGMSRGGFFHIPLLFVGFSMNGFAVIILGIGVSLTWNK